MAKSCGNSACDEIRLAGIRTVRVAGNRPGRPVESSVALLSILNPAEVTSKPLPANGRGTSGFELGTTGSSWR